MNECNEDDHDEQLAQELAALEETAASPRSAPQLYAWLHYITSFILDILATIGVNFLWGIKRYGVGPLTCLFP